jgi:hypothetical protein
MKKANCFAAAVVVAALSTVAHTAGGAVITLNTLDQSLMVGFQDTDANTAPAAVGDGWYTGPYAGTVRAAGDLGENNRTQWYFVFDISSLDGIDPGDITSVELQLPQIGRINATNNNSAMALYDPNFTWDTGGSNYPTWNAGASTNGGTLLGSIANAATMFGIAMDTSNPDVEGTFTYDSAALLATVQSWATDSANNEGFLLHLTQPQGIALAFGTPSLVVTTTAVIIPAPAALPAGLTLLGLAAWCRRRHS